MPNATACRGQWLPRPAVCHARLNELARAVTQCRLESLRGKPGDPHVKARVWTSGRQPNHLEERRGGLDQLGKEYVGSTFVLLLGTATAQGLFAAAMLLTARQLGPAGYGPYAACLAVCGLSSVLFDLGLDTWLLREGAHEPTSLRRLLGSTLVIKTILGIPWILAMAVVLPKLNPVAFPTLLVSLCALAIWLDALFMAGMSGLKALMRNQATAVSVFISRAILLAGTVLLISHAARGAASFAFARVVAGLATVLLLLRHPGFSIPKLDVVWFKRIAWEALPFAASAVLTMIYMRADVAIIALALDARVTGLYSAASGLINALFFVPATVYSVAVPALVRALGEPEQTSPDRLLMLTFAAFAAVGCSLWGGLWLCGDRILLALLGNGFAESRSILLVLGPILLLKSLSFGLAAVLVAAGWQYARSGAQAVSALANVTLNVLVVRAYGAIGVAWVYVFSEIILLAAYAVLCRRWWRGGQAQIPEKRKV